MEESINMLVQTEKKDYAKHHHTVMDKIINDHMASLKCERVVDFSPYEHKNTIKQMSALKVKMEALQELIEMEKTMSKNLRTNLFG